MNCPHCYVHARNWEKKISKERVLKLIGEAKKLNFTHIDFTGGETLLIPELFDYIVEAKNLDLNVSINTNLLLLDYEKAKFIKENDVYLYVSVDGSDKEIYEKLRGKGTFDILLKKLEILNNLDIPYSVIFSVSTFNYKDLPNMVDFAKKNLAKELCIIPVIPSGEAKKSHIYLDSSRILESIKELSVKAMEENYKINIWCAPFLKLLDLPQNIYVDKCHAFDFIDLAPTGDILICDVIDIPIAEIRTKSLKEAINDILKNPLYKELKERTNYCYNCEILDFCGGGCYARSWIINGDLRKPDPYCPNVLTAMGK